MDDAKLMTHDIFNHAILSFPNLSFVGINGANQRSKIALTEILSNHPNLIVQANGPIYTHPQLEVSNIVINHNHLKLAEWDEGYLVVNWDTLYMGQKNNVENIRELDLSSKSISELTVVLDSQLEKLTICVNFIECPLDVCKVLEDLAYQRIYPNLKELHMEWGLNGPEHLPTFLGLW